MQRYFMNKKSNLTQTHTMEKERKICKNLHRFCRLLQPIFTPPVQCVPPLCGRNPQNRPRVLKYRRMLYEHPTGDKFPSNVQDPTRSDGGNYRTTASDPRTLGPNGVLAASSAAVVSQLSVWVALRDRQTERQTDRQTTSWCFAIVQTLICCGQVKIFAQQVAYNRSTTSSQVG